MHLVSTWTPSEPVATNGKSVAPVGSSTMVTTDEDDRIWCAVPPHARFTYFGAPEQTAAAWRDKGFAAFKSAGIDPEKTVTTLTEMLDVALRGKPLPAMVRDVGCTGSTR